MTIEPLGAGSLGLFIEFIERVPEDDRTFAKEDLSDRAALTTWAADTRVLRRIAIDGDKRVIGYAAISAGIGLSRHVGELRLLVDPAARNQGVGRSLARRILTEAIPALSLRKIVVEVVAQQEPAIRMFRAMGFTAEAILRDHLRSRQGEMRDLLLLAHLVGENWEGLAGLGIEREIG
jgi:RimJ/RimL family protein N-acetyltransferase